MICTAGSDLKTIQTERQLGDCRISTNRYTCLANAIVDSLMSIAWDEYHLWVDVVQIPGSCLKFLVPRVPHVYELLDPAIELSRTATNCLDISTACTLPIPMPVATIQLHIE